MTDRLRIDWSNLGPLPAPKREDVRLATLLARPVRKRNHPKRHGENRERSREAAAKAAASTKAIEANDAEKARRRAIARAYWRGEINDLGGLER